MKEEKLMKTDDEFFNEIKEIKLKRIRSEKDDFMRGDRRLTKALVRSMYWKPLKESLIVSDLEEDEIEKKIRKGRKR